MAYRSGDTVVVTQSFQDINAKIFPGDVIELTKLRQTLDGVESWTGWLERHGFKTLVTLDTTHFKLKSEEA